MKLILSIIFLLSFFKNFAQDILSTKDSLTFIVFLETYYSYDFNRPSNHTRPPFIYSHNRHNEFNLNLGFIKAGYSSNRARASLALATGTYMNANYSAEPGVLKNIFEANVGIRLGNKNLWLETGIFPSHIGFESAVSKDCWILTRSLLADNSPYYEAGVKLTYISGNEKWLLSGLALNGWQRITRVDGNSLMSWGTQVQYKTNGKLLLNYSTFIGTDKPDSSRLFRMFHNLYGIINLTDKFGITAGFDLGIEDKSKERNDKNTWYAPVLIAKYIFNNKWSLAGRLEHYNDKNGVIIRTGRPGGFRVTGYSLNLDHNLTKNVQARIEARKLWSKDNIFQRLANSTNKTSFITGSISMNF